MTAPEGRRRRLPRLGLRTKFFLYSNSLIVVTLALVTFLMIAKERENRLNAIVDRGRSIAETLAVPVTDALMYEENGLVAEAGLINSLIDQVLNQNRDLLRYVVVTDPHGRVTHSNRWELLGKNFPRALGAQDVGRPVLVERVADDGAEPMVEVRTTLNIASRTWGSLAVGFSLGSVAAQTRATAWRLAAIGLVLLLGNSLLTAFYVESLIRPILGLNRTMKAAAGGDLLARAPRGLNDEVGELSLAFNRMMGEIVKARASETMRRAQMAQAEKMAALGTLAAGVAHEVNNPLAGILTCVETLQQRPDDAALRARYLPLVEDGLKRIEHIIAGLLDYSRPAPSRLQPVDVNERVERVLELLSYQLRKRGIEVARELDPAAPRALADGAQLEQVVLNLALNAAQAMDHGGRLTVRSAGAAAGAEVTLDIADDGPGVPAELRDRIFDPFFTTRAVGEGTGLGLAVTYAIVEAHRGSIEVGDEPGRGARFRVRLPSANAPSAAPADHPAPETA